MILFSNNRIDRWGLSASDSVVSQAQKDELNNLVAQHALSFVGSGYFLGGEVPTNEGGAGIDCSELPQLAAERASGVPLRDRSADGMYTDSDLMVEGSGGIGSINFFDLDGDGDIDHATTVTGNETEVHPSSTTGTINLVEEGSIDQFAETVYNREFSWDYILEE